MILRYLLIWDKGLEFERFQHCWGSQTSPWGPHLWHWIVTNSTATEPTKQRDSRISTRCWAPDDTKGARIEGGRAIFSRKNLRSCTTKKKACGWHPTNPTAQRPIHRLKKRVATYNLLSWLFELTALRWRTWTANIVAWPCHLLVQMVLSGLPQLSQNVARKVLRWSMKHQIAQPSNLRLAPQRKDPKTAKWPGFQPHPWNRKRLLKQHFLMCPFLRPKHKFYKNKESKSRKMSTALRWTTECKGVNWKGWPTSCQASMLWPWLVPTKWEHPIMCIYCESTSGRCQEFR